MFIPMIIEQNGRGERAMDLPSRLLKDRIIMLTTDVNDQSCSIIVQQLLYLKSQSNDPIHLYIQSPGGSVVAGLSVIGTLRALNAGGVQINTYCLGMAASMGSIIASCGTKGHRYMLQFSTHMLHNLSSSNGRQSLEDQRINHRESERLNEMLTKIYSENTGQTVKKLNTDMARDFYLDADQSIKYGLADSIITKM